MKSLLSLILCLFALPALAQKADYNVMAIPDSLTKNTNVVVRKLEQTFIIEGLGKSRTRVHCAYTILNKAGDSYATLQLYQDRFDKVKSIDGNLYDAQGKRLTSLKGSNIEEKRFEEDYEFTDGRYKIARFEYAEYPYTVEFEYESTSTQMMFYTHFMPQGAAFEAVQSAKFEIIAPTNLAFRYIENNLPAKANISKQGETTSYKWQVSNLPALRPEPFAPPLQDIVPSVWVAPNEFEVGEYKGNGSSWKNLGEFQNKLNEGRDVLPADVAAQVQKVAAGAPTKYEKTKRIYEYLQSKTRYISIQLGIGGWQPIPAETVDKKGYGDCKGLSNYMKAMLKTAGIESHYAIINAGKHARTVKPDFPSSYFNHIILCVPMERDTVWLECTNQNQPFNFLGSFTDNRYCLLVTPQGGKLVKTPRYTQNKQTRFIRVRPTASGGAVAVANTTFTGLQTENGGLNYVIQRSKDDQKKWLVERHLDMPQYDLTSFEMQASNNETPAITQKIQVELKSFGTKNGKRIFLTPNLMNKSGMNLPENDKRRHEIVIDNYEFTDIDTVRYELPEGYHIEGTPTQYDIKSEFGEYKTTITAEQGALLYIRTFTMRNGRFPKTKYKELTEFFRSINKADNAKIVLVKET